MGVWIWYGYAPFFSRYHLFAGVERGYTSRYVYSVPIRFMSTGICGLGSSFLVAISKSDLSRLGWLFVLDRVIFMFC